MEFKDLGLAVIDEEHRFGVMQRRRLLKSRPDVLVMVGYADPALVGTYPIWRLGGLTD